MFCAESEGMDSGTLFDRDSYNEFLVFKACQTGDMKLLTELHKKGVNLNVVDWDKRSPLHLAVYKDRIEIADYLSKQGLDINAQDRWGVTPLGMAVREVTFLGFTWLPI
eukprot:TRINITY_DN8146_c0_g2_i2.p1 TRINITY_DN8146_c0_g2~~TRINITY_DN8146_c0_g2_i2.p1  ORF type:complete len:119 (-),score=32.79 TRINITY_DN8146_c0_g2_i2:239-565(-)